LELGILAYLRGTLSPPVGSGGLPKWGTLISISL
jgi:hypothetical protein